MSSFMQFPLNIKFRILSSFFSKTIGAATSPFLILYLTNYLNDVFLGLLLLLSISLNFISSIIGGYLSDIFNRKRFITTFQTVQIVLLSILTFELYFLEKNPQEGVLLYCIVISYVLQGVIGGTYKPAYNALIMDSTNKDNRRDIYRFNYWTTNLSLAVGTSLGGWFSSNHLISLYVTSIFILILVTIGFFIIIENDNQIFRKEVRQNNFFVNLFHNYKEALKNKDWIIFLLGSAFIFSVEFSLIYYSNIRLARDFSQFSILGIDISGIRMFSVLQLINTILVIFFTFQIGRVVEKWSTKNALLIGVFLYICGYSLISYNLNFFILILCVIIATIGELIFSPNWQAAQIEFIPRDKRGSFSALSALSNVLALLMASGYLLLSGHLNISIISILIFIIGVIGLILVSLTLVRKNRLE
ncbi:MFS transporter [Paenibacillus amylolyticus]|uniref:MFS transporter n=1 Tax=Paenibacillus TaxID=44249 RepID=UPI001059EB31|nr:MFS transporter [Paenibacillus amylolyticus]TDL65602.1 MFS transporter [Paenibacillus amylolyticus]